jgi:tripartite-type tricarboxylate transporter receptor subunit TctC
LQHHSAWLALGLCLAWNGAASAADPVADFYKDKTVTISIGAAPAGGNDTYGRIVAKYLGRHIPGNPTVIAQNMPGATGLVAANWIYNAAPKDGTAIGFLNRATVTEHLFENPEAKFDARKMGWIGSPSQQIDLVFSWYETPYKKLDDLRKGEMVVGGSAAQPGSETSVMTSLIKETLGISFKTIYGYGGVAESFLAMERREIEGKVGPSWDVVKATRPDWVRDKKVLVLLQLGLVKDEELQDVPLIMDLVTKPADKQLLELHLSKLTVAYPVGLPPDVPPERLVALRAAHAATMKDPDFLAEAEKGQLLIRPVSGADVEALMNRLYAAPKDILERAKGVR